MSIHQQWDGGASIFLCPECGAQVRLAGSPGRHVKCKRCATLVELPYLPRATRRRRALAGPWWLWAGIVAVCAVVTSVAIGLHWIRQSHWRSAVASRLMVADAAERDGRLDQATEELRTALALARVHDIPVPESRIRQRESLAQRAALQRLDQVKALPPTEAVRALVALRDRAETDPALATLRGRIVPELNAARLREAEAALATATARLDAGQGALALEAVIGVPRLVEGLEPATVQRLLGDAQRFGARIATRFGLRIEPVRGQFVLGSIAQYEARIQSPVLQALAQLGYVPTPEEPTWRAIWERDAPFQLEVQVQEQSTRYLESANHASQLSAQVQLLRDKKTIWTARLSGQTRVPPRGMSAYEASLAAASIRPLPGIEHRLHEDAFQILVDRMTLLIKGLPPPGAVRDLEQQAGQPPVEPGLRIIASSTA